MPLTVAVVAIKSQPLSNCISFHINSVTDFCSSESSVNLSANGDTKSRTPYCSKSEAFSVALVKYSIIFRSICKEKSVDNEDSVLPSMSISLLISSSLSTLCVESPYTGVMYKKRALVISLSVTFGDCRSSRACEYLW